MEGFILNGNKIWQWKLYEVALYILSPVPSNILILSFYLDFSVIASILFWYILDEDLWVVLYPKTTYRVYYVKIEGSIHTLWFIVLIILLTFFKRNPPQKYMFMHVGIYILFLCNES